MRNRSLRFVCDMVTLRVEVADSLFTHGCAEGTLLRMPVAHGEGCYFADAETLRDLNEYRQVILRYADRDGRVVRRGQSERIRSKISPGFAIGTEMFLDLMPHPDRACDERLGSADGAKDISVDDADDCCPAKSGRVAKPSASHREPLRYRNRYRGGEDVYGHSAFATSSRIRKILRRIQANMLWRPPRRRASARGKQRWSFYR